MITNLVRRGLSCLPLTFGPGGVKWRMIRRVLDPLLHRHVPEALDTKYGQLSIDGSHEGPRLLTYGFDNIIRHYEASDLGKIIRAMGKQGGTFVDIGANLGMYALIARSAGFDTFVVEPEPSHADFLRRNEDVFGKVHAIGLSDNRGSLPLFYEAGNTGATSFVKTAMSQELGDGVPVEVFAEVAAKGGFGLESEISLLKIDVEGHEVEMVNGLRAFLAKGHRPVIWCEVRGDRSGRRGGSFRPVIAALSEFGYIILDPERWTETSADDPDLADRQVFDLLFVGNAGQAESLREKVNGERTPMQWRKAG